MGMHRDSSNLQFEPIECNVRRQVWWSIYIFEKILCGILGRPTGIDDREVAMKVPDAPMLEQTRITAIFMNLCSDLVSLSYRILLLYTLCHLPRLSHTKSREQRLLLGEQSVTGF